MKVEKLEKGQQRLPRCLAQGAWEERGKEVGWADRETQRWKKV